MKSFVYSLYFIAVASLILAFMSFARGTYLVSIPFVFISIVASSSAAGLREVNKRIDAIENKDDKKTAHPNTSKLDRSVHFE